MKRAAVVFFCTLTLVAGALTGCLADGAGLSDELDGGFAPCDGGFAGNGDAVVVDAGECAVPLDSVFDGEGEGAQVPEDNAAVCAALVAKACGDAGECADDGSCAAADLTARFEPENCDEGLADNATFPACTAGSCDRLVEKVCGPAPQACAEAPGCGPATTLSARSDDGDASAEASCGSALSDEALFPPCGG